MPRVASGAILKSRPAARKALSRAMGTRDDEAGAAPREGQRHVGRHVAEGVLPGRRSMRGDVHAVDEHGRCRAYAEHRIGDVLVVLRRGERGNPAALGEAAGRDVHVGKTAERLDGRSACAKRQGELAGQWAEYASDRSALRGRPDRRIDPLGGAIRQRPCSGTHGYDGAPDKAVIRAHHHAPNGAWSMHTAAEPLPGRTLAESR